jgi:hypothetical protein
MTRSGHLDGRSSLACNLPLPLGAGQASDSSGDSAPMNTEDSGDSRARPD